MSHHSRKCGRGKSLLSSNKTFLFFNHGFAALLWPSFFFFFEDNGGVAHFKPF